MVIGVYEDRGQWSRSLGLIENRSTVMLNLIQYLGQFGGTWEK
jgi:hypothetical protein